MGKYIIQKPREFDACKAAVRKGPGIDALAAQGMFVQPKYDGCALVVRTFVAGGKQEADVLTSTGEDVLSCAHIGESVLRAFGPGWVVFGEAWEKGRSQADISGDVRRHTAAPSLGMVVYDMVVSSSYAMGQDASPYQDRLKVIQGIYSSNFETATWPTQSIRHAGIIDCNAEAAKLVAMGGYDGLILRHPGLTWSPGYVEDGTFIKVKPTLSLDLRCIGVEEGKGKLAGHAGKLVFSLRGREVRAAGGTYPERKEWLQSPPIGSIFEVGAMGYTEDGLLREPRIKSLRHDKVKADDE